MIPARPDQGTVADLRREVARTRNRQLLFFAVPSVLAVLWCLLLLTARTEDVTGAFVFLEVLTLVPVVFGARRLVRLSSLLGSTEPPRQDVLVDEVLRIANATYWQTNELRNGRWPDRSAPEVDAAVQAISRAAWALQPMVRRRTDLEGLVERSRSDTASATVQTALAACREDIDRVQSAITNTAASVTALAETDPTVGVQPELGPVLTSTAELDELLATLDEVASTRDLARPPTPG